MCVYLQFKLDISLILASRKNTATNLIQGVDNKVTENQMELKKINFNLTKLKNKIIKIDENLVFRSQTKNNRNEKMNTGIIKMNRVSFKQCSLIEFETVF